MHRLLVALMLVGALARGGVAAAQSVAPPAQLAEGPGGSAYAYAEVEAVHLGEQPTGAWLFEPVRPEGDEAQLPVVVFLHGYTATDPARYQAWIDHLARRGNVVVFPDYQVDDPLGEPPLAYTGNMIEGVRIALDELRSPGHPPVDLAAVTVAGHSMGGVLALNYAALAGGLDLPVPSAVMAVNPGGCTGCGGPAAVDFGVPYRDLSTIDPATRLLLVTGEDDDFVGQTPAVVAWDGTAQIPGENRDYLVARTDRRGSTELLADHVFPQTSGDISEVDALDWYGSWKWLDGLIACGSALSGCDESMNGGSTQLDMGTWGDGTPVTPPLLVELP